MDIVKLLTMIGVYIGPLISTFFLLRAQRIQRHSALLLSNVFRPWLSGFYPTATYDMIEQYTTKRLEDLEYSNQAKQHLKTGYKEFWNRYQKLKQNDREKDKQYTALRDEIEISIFEKIDIPEWSSQVPQNRRAFRFHHANIVLNALQDKSLREKIRLEIRPAPDINAYKLIIMPREEETARSPKKEELEEIKRLTEDILKSESMIKRAEELARLKSNIESERTRLRDELRQIIEEAEVRQKLRGSCYACKLLPPLGRFLRGSS